MRERPEEPHDCTDQKLNDGTVFAKPRQHDIAAGDADDEPHQGSDGTRPDERALHKS